MAMMNRRELIMRLGGGAVAVSAAAILLEACGSDKKASPATTGAPTTTTPSSTAATTAPTTGGSTVGTTGASTVATTGGSTAPVGDLGEMSLRLSWIKNSEFAGSYIADNKGYYKANGFSSVNLIAGGPSAQPAEVDVSSGTALVGISAPDLVASAIGQGGELIIIGAEYQKNPFAVMSLASNPVKTPQDMYGKKFGLQAANQTVWDAFVAASGIDDSKITKFPAQFDPTPLVNGECDCWFSFVTNEPNTLKTQGVDTVTFLLADFGYPLVSEVYVVKKDSITSKKAALKAFLKSEIQGWKDLYADPGLGASLTTGTYGKDLGLDTAEQTLEVKSELTLIFTDETKKNGVFTISDALIAENVTVLGKAGITIKAEDLFDMSLLAEVYKENPDLVATT